MCDGPEVGERPARTVNTDAGFRRIAIRRWTKPPVGSSKVKQERQAHRAVVAGRIIFFLPPSHVADVSVSSDYESHKDEPAFAAKVLM